MLLALLFVAHYEAIGYRFLLEDEHDKEELGDADEGRHEVDHSPELIRFVGFQILCVRQDASQAVSHEQTAAERGIVGHG